MQGTLKMKVFLKFDNQGTLLVMKSGRKMKSDQMDGVKKIVRDE